MNATYPEDKIRGDNAESVFLEIIMNSMLDWKCIQYGVEKHVVELKTQIKDIYISEAKRIRRMPDFVCINKSNNKVLFCEIKRKRSVGIGPNILNFHFKKNQISEYVEHWPDAYLILAHKLPPYFYVIRLRDIDSSKMLVATNVYANLENASNGSQPMDRWNFFSISKDLKSIFPELKDEIIEKAGKNLID